MKTFILSLLAVIIIGGGGYALVHKSSNKPATSTNSQSQSTSTKANSTPSTASNTNINASDTITFDGKQFSPASLSVKSGATVTVKNTSSQDVQMDSDPHPTHTDDTDLNVGLVSPGQSRSFTVTKTGSFGYHDHLDPGIIGRITIE